MQTNKQTKQQTTAGTFLWGTAEVLGNICDVGYIQGIKKFLLKN